MDPLWILLIGTAAVVGSILGLRLHAFLALILGALIVSALTPGTALDQFARAKNMSETEAERFLKRPAGQRVAAEFGSTAGRVGILIALAAIIGRCLYESGGAERIVRSALSLVGEQRAPLAFLIGGFVLGVPVFFDTVFFLMIPLAYALAARTGHQFGLYVMSIIAGTTMAHSLVPPTPGPLFVAGALGVDVGLMMLGGTLVGLITSTAGYLYARWADRRWPVPLRDTVSGARQPSPEDPATPAALPSLSFSLLPVVLPVILIAGNTVLNLPSFTDATARSPDVRRWAGILGEPNVALGIACAISLFLLVRHRRAASQSAADSVQAALATGGIVILITSAGGAFGAMLQQAGVAERIRDLSSGLQLALLPLAFGITTLVRIAQGSATVAMITAVGIVAQISPMGTLPFHPLYLALAIGCGSKPFPWMNDSGFWVICKMSGMTIPETLRNFSVMLTVMGLIGLAVTVLGAAFFPMTR